MPTKIESHPPFEIRDRAEEVEEGDVGDRDDDHARGGAEHDTGRDLSG